MQYFWHIRENIPDGVGMGQYTAGHIGWLIAGALICLALALVYRKMSEKGRAGFLKVLALLMVTNEIAKDLMLISVGEMRASYLPLHLCSINIFVCMFYAFKPNRVVAELLYCLCLPGALLALVFPSWNSLPVLNFMSLHSFTIHFELILFPILLLAGGCKPDYRMIPKCLLCLVCAAVPIYLLNLWLDTNFMFLNWPEEGTPLVLFAEWFGDPGYLIGMPIMAAALWLVMYLPWVIAEKRKKA